jgi:large subunit ribosomal protein L6
MKKPLFQEIEIPEGVEVEIDGILFKVKGAEGENQRSFKIGKIDLEKKENKIIIGTKKASKKEKKMINTTVAHMKNMIQGIQEKFKYELRGCYSHFPFTIDLEGDVATIKNFLGEKIPRKVNFPKGVEIEIGKDANKKIPITIKSLDRELVGQAAANFEMATKVRNKDRRVFQDGIFIVNKAGKEI